MTLSNDPGYGLMRGKSVTKAMTLPTYTVAALPAPASYTGRMVNVSNGAAGQPCLAYSNGTAWLRILLGAAVAAS
jgi:hypothetical protein